MPNNTSDTFPFQDRRSLPEEPSYNGLERRQFTNSHSELSSPARELGQAIDQYKLHNRRRYITYEEMYNIMAGLGYRKVTPATTSATE